MSDSCMSVEALLPLFRYPYCTALVPSGELLGEPTVCMCTEMVVCSSSHLDSMAVETVHCAGHDVLLLSIKVPGWPPGTLLKEH